MHTENKITFGRWETVNLLIDLICTKCILYYVRMLNHHAATASWIMSLYLSVVIIIVFAVLISLYKKFEGEDIIEISETAGGKPLKIIVGLIITTVLLFLMMSMMREFSEEIKTISLPTSPLIFIMMLFLIGAVVGSFLGIEAIIRYHAIMVPVITVIYLLIIIGVIPHMDINNIYPILGSGAKKIFADGLLKISVYGELLILFLLPPFIKSYKSLRSSGFIALGISSFILGISALAYTMVVPYPKNLQSFLPIYQLTKLVRFGRSFQRIEAAFVFIWAMIILLYVTTIFYFTIYAFSRAMGLKYIRPLILPFALILLSISFIPEGLSDAVRIEEMIMGSWLWIAIFAAVGLIFIAASIRSKKRRREDEV